MRCKLLVVLYLFLSVPNLFGAYLHQAVKYNDLTKLKSFLQDHPDTASVINLTIKGGVSALHLASVLNRVDAAKILIDAGANINATTDNGFTPLFWAAESDSIEVAELLIKSGANVNHKTQSGITPLHWAARKNSQKVVKLLIESGALLDSPTAAGFTPLHWAVMHGSDDAAFLIAYKAASDEIEKEDFDDFNPSKISTVSNLITFSDNVNKSVKSEPKILENSAFGRILTIDLGFGESLSFVWVKDLSLWVGQFEITNGQFRRFRPYHSSMFFEEFSLDGADQPVVFVSWHDATAFCNWLNKEHANRIPYGWKARLPTEAEWTVFASCGDKRIYPWGNEWPPKYGNYSDLTARRKLTEWNGINGYDDGFVVTCPVSLSGVNEWGIYGLAGNVWEWCYDWYDDSKTRKTRRGGSWDFDTRPNIRIDARGFDFPDAKYDTIGFRVVIAKKD